MHKSSKGASPPPSGWTIELIVAFIDDDECLRHFVILIQDILAGEVDPRIRPLFLGAFLSALAKPGSLNPRPVANGESFSKIAAKYVMEAVVAPRFPHFFPMIQLGLGSAGGSERAIHILQSFIDVGQQGQPGLIISADAINAFNARDRSQILAEAYSHPELSPLYNFIDWLYGIPSSLVYRSQGTLLTFESATGVRQGCILAAFLYALSVQPHYSAALNESNAQAVAIIDDLYIHGSTTDALSAFDAYSASLTNANAGIDLHRNHPSKSWAMWTGASPPPPELESQCAERGLRLIRSDCTKVLGSFIGSSRDAIRQAVNGKLPESLLLMNGVKALHKHVNNSQVANLLLRYCTLTKPTYLLRTIPPDLTEEFCSGFDAAFLEAYASATGLPLPLSSEASFDLQLPFRLGGCGLRPTLRTRFAAFWGSALSALASVIASVPNEHAHSISIIDSLRRTYDTFVQTGVQPDGVCLFDSFDASVNPFTSRSAPPGFQRLVTHAMENKLDADRLADLWTARDYPTLTRTFAARAPLSAAWLVSIPTDASLSLPSWAFSFALRHRLGIMPVDEMPTLCACGNTLGDSANPYHFHSCVFHKRRSVTIRHDLLTNLFAALCRESNAITLVEDHWRERDWPDLEIFFNAGPNNGHVISDTSVICPCAPSHIERGLNCLANARARAELKSNRYLHVAQELGADIQPLVFESIGGVSRSTQTLLARLVASYAMSSASEMSPSAWAGKVRQQLSVCLQRGNAMVDNAGVRHALRASRHV